MTTKLVSANMGIILVVEQDGEEKTLQFSITTPSLAAPEFTEALDALCDFLNDNFGTGFEWANLGLDDVQIAKPKRIKAPRPVSQNEFNKKIKQLGYKP